MEWVIISLAAATSSLFPLETKYLKDPNKKYIITAAVARENMGLTKKVVACPKDVIFPKPKHSPI